jgi:hypothetical protein
MTPSAKQVNISRDEAMTMYEWYANFRNFFLKVLLYLVVIIKSSGCGHLTSRTRLPPPFFIGLFRVWLAPTRSKKYWIESWAST